MRRNWLEWFVLALSMGAILAVATVLLLDGVGGASDPPDPRVELRMEEARESEVGWILPATVTNQGDQAAEAITLEATAMVDGEEETSEVSIDFLPADSEVDVEIGFSGPPESEVQVRLVGQRLP